MDPHSSAQDVHRCDLSETAIVHSSCDFCHVNLCKPCIVDHILDGYHKHTIVHDQPSFILNVEDIPINIANYNATIAALLFALPA